MLQLQNPMDGAGIWTTPKIQHNWCCRRKLCSEAQFEESLSHVHFAKVQTVSIVHVIKINQDQKASQAQHISFHISTCIRPSDATDITWLPPRLVRGRWALATSTAPWASTAMALAPALNSCAEVWTKAMAASASSWSSWMNSVKALNFSGTMWYNGTIKMEDSIFEANKIPEWYIYIYTVYIPILECLLQGRICRNGSSY